MVNQAQISCEASLGRGKKVYINGLGHMTKMATMPIYGKNLKNLLQDQRSYDLETWDVSLGDSSSTKFI